MDGLSSLPRHGRVACSKCHEGEPCVFDRTVTERDGWRIKSNPMAWGSERPVVVVLGFSKGPSQSGSLAATPHDTVPFRGGRTQLSRILHHVGLLRAPDARLLDAAITDRSGLYHFGSLVRCTVERWDGRKGKWTATGGGMLDRFVATRFGHDVATTCSSEFLGHLPGSVRVVVMLGLGTDLGYVAACRTLWERTRPGAWRSMNDIAYTDGAVTVVHTEHFRSQERLLPDWLSGQEEGRGRYGLMARRAVALGLG